MSFYIHLPLVIFVTSLVYSASRYDDWRMIFRETLTWAFRMSSFLLTIGVILYVLSTYL
ncbi:MAG: hypothetical protein R3B84_07300 [Zavarzinella sp.]